MKKPIKLPISIDQRPEDNPYPTNSELLIIRKWDILQYDIPGLIEYINCVWWAPDWGFKLSKGRDRLFHRRCIKLQLHTGGWSGNEDVIVALQQNFLFWSMFWRKHTAGGHYWFEIAMKEWNRSLSKKQYYELKERTDIILNKDKARDK